ncbi:hypothetical protein STAS_14847 [Striga asiatica]|uniref:Uncharacterized protein n=1 Tax=Striga asiatica TaxID=4170 RepID=A0A5A7Q1U6_STRAF|nr:hypothetical protein STAS_14847 [Striga asiatica]
MDFDDDEHGFGSGYGFPPSMVSLTPFSHSASPATRRLSSCFTPPNEPVRAKRQLAWVSLQGRLVGADEASSAKTIDPGGLLGAKEAAAWELFTPMQRVLTVAVAAAAAGNSEKNKQISKLQRSVELRDQVLINMQQKLDNLCEQVNYSKDLPGVPKEGDVLVTQREDCACKFSTPSKELTGDEMLEFELKPDERRMSDLSDWAPSVTSSLDMQLIAERVIVGNGAVSIANGAGRVIVDNSPGILDSLVFDHDVSILRKECEEKDITIKELSTYIRSSEVLGSKRIAELEDIIRRKNMIINKLRKDIITLEQKVVNLTRLKRSSFSSTYSKPQSQPILADNLLYDMDSTTDPSSSDSDGSPKTRKQALDLNVETNSVQTIEKTSEGEEVKCIQVKSPTFVEQNHSPSTSSPLKEIMSNQIPNAGPPVKPKRTTNAGGENRSRRPPVKSKEVAVIKRWL